MRHFIEIFDVDDLDLWPFELKINTPVTPAVRNVQITFGFLRLCPILCPIRDRQTDKRANPVMRFISTTVITCSRTEKHFKSVLQYFNKKSEVLPMKRARAYSGSCSQVILAYLHPFRRNLLFCTHKLPKNTKNRISRFKVNQGHRCWHS